MAGPAGVTAARFCGGLTRSPGAVGFAAPCVPPLPGFRRADRCSRVVVTVATCSVKCSVVTWNIALTGKKLDMVSVRSGGGSNVRDQVFLCSGCLTHAQGGGRGGGW